MMWTTRSRYSAVGDPSGPTWSLWFCALEPSVLKNRVFEAVDLLTWPGPPPSCFDVVSPRATADGCRPLRPGLDSFPEPAPVLAQARGYRSGTGIPLTQTRWVFSIFTLFSAKNSLTDFLWSSESEVQTCRSYWVNPCGLTQEPSDLNSLCFHAEVFFFLWFLWDVCFLSEALTEVRYHSSQELHVKKTTDRRLHRFTITALLTC